MLATLEYLAESGLRPTVTSLKCGHGFFTSSGNVSHHSSGNAVDIAKINGVPILGHQEPGGVTDTAVRSLMRLQGTLRPDQIISLLEIGGPTVAMGDHADHIHVGFRPLFGSNKKLGQAGARRAQARPVVKPARSAAPDREPGRPDEALEVRDHRAQEEARIARPPGRVVAALSHVVHLWRVDGS